MKSKLKIILIAVFAPLIISCDKDEIEVKYNLSGDWRVISYEDHETSTVITKTKENTWDQFNNGDVMISFSETGLTSGEISGIKVTNTFSGDYTIDNDGAITISNFYQTLVNEPEWGRLFNSIGNVDGYIVLDNHLILYFNQKKNSITLENVQ